MSIDLWLKAWNEEAEGVDLTDARVGGRATKENPNKEDAKFWNTAGPKWVADYITWRKNNTDWKIWKTPQGNPAIELALTPEFAGVPVKMVIDRVFEYQGNLVVVDLKTSQQTPASTLQLGFYKVGIERVLGAEVKYGAYWMARQSGTTGLVDLSGYTPDKLDYLAENFDKARKSAIFLPNTNNCQYRCGFTDYCQFSAKVEK
jgi:hypothetical protein